MDTTNRVISKSKDMPLLSIIVPAYNVETYINACIDSILSDTYPNKEISLRKNNRSIMGYIRFWKTKMEI